MHKDKHKDDCGCSGSMKSVIDKVYNMGGENYLSPHNKSIADGFWTAGQSEKLGKGFMEPDSVKKSKGGKS